VPTVDFISPGGAFSPAGVGDAQDLTTIFTISSGSPTLTCNGASPFVSGDTGKSFNLTLAGPSAFTGDTLKVLSGTLTFVSSTQVTLSVNAAAALAATSARLVWGTDNAPAARAFNDWAQIQVSPITLTLGSGSKSFFFTTLDSNQKRGNSFAWNVAQPLTVVGNGQTTTKLIGGSPGAFGLGVQFNIQSGNGAYSNTSIWTARLQTVLSGASTATCVTTADAALFSNNTWALISGIDLQGAGSPPNAFYFEYVFISNVNAGTGVITFSLPLANTYKSTWPNYNPGTAGLHPDCGGPATLYVIDQAWAINATYQSLGTDNSLLQGQTGFNGLTTALSDVKCLDSLGIIPSVNKSFTCTGCDLSGYEMEVDKMLYSGIFDSTQAHLKFQSSNNQVVVRNGSTVQFNGTPRFLTISDSTIINQMLIGCTSYGRAETLSMTNVTFDSAVVQNYNGIVDTGDISGHFTTDYSMSGGIITIPRSGLSSVRWGVPGTLCYWINDFGAYGPSFVVTDVTADVTNIYVQTDQSGGFPSFASGLIVSACPSVTSVNTSGTAKANNLTNMTSAGYGGRPIGSYATFTFTGATMGYNATGFQASMPDEVWGNVVSFTINVTTPYTGVNTPLTYNAGIALNGVGGSATVILPNGTTAQYIPVIDLQRSGIRTITPTGVVGSGGSDSSLTLPGPTSWLTEAFDTKVYANNNVVSEYNGNPALGPVFTITIVTNSGQLIPTAVVPLRLRLHA